MKSEINTLIKALFDLIYLNNLTSPVGRQSTNTWSMIADNFVLSEENILIMCRLILRLFLSNEDAKIEKDLKEAIFTFYQNDNFLMLVAYGMLESNRPNLTGTSLQLFAELHQFANSNTSYLFPSEKFLELTNRLKLENISTCNREQPATVTNLNITSDSNAKSSLKADLLDMYEKKIEEKLEQETQMSIMLNQYISRCLSLENETKTSRDKIREYSHRITQLTKDMASFEVRNADLVRSNQDLKISNSQLSQDKKHLDQEYKKAAEQMEALKSNFEKEQLDNEEAITKLQEQLKYEQVERKQVHNKLNDARSKLSEADKVKQSLEAKSVELETELAEKAKEFDTMKDEFDKVKKEYHRAKEILSYVKSNA